MRKRTVIAAALLPIIGISGLALAHGKHHRGMNVERMFEAADLNADGIMTRTEAKQAAALRFTQIDADNDGTISRDEHKAHRTKMRADRFAQMDTNGDGAFTLDELEAKASERAAKRFALMDADNDGRVTMEEAQAMRKMRGHHGGRGEGKGGHAMGHFRGGMTLDKVDARIDRMFDRVDADGDDSITLEDIRAMRKGHNHSDQERG